MGGKKLLWILLGISLIVLTAAKSSQVEVDEVDDEIEEDDDDDECDPDCEKNCHKLKCASGSTTRDSCGCCECKLAEGEYCYVKPPKRSMITGRKDPKLKSRLLPSFLSLTPPYTYAPATTSFTNNFALRASYEEHTASASSSSSSPTIAEIYNSPSSSPINVDSVTVKSQKNRKLKQAPQNPSGPPLKHWGIYSSESNDLKGNHDGGKVSLHDVKTFYRTCGDYLKCEPLFPIIPEGGGGDIEKSGEELFTFGGGGAGGKNKNPKLKAKKRTPTTERKVKKSQLTKRLKKRDFNFGRYWDRDGSDFNANRLRKKKSNSNTNTDIIADTTSNSKVKGKNPSLLRDDINNNFDDYFFNLFFPPSSPFLLSTTSQSESNKIYDNDYPRSLEEPTVGTCVCRYAVTVCASDGKTYRNICHLRSVSGLGEGSNPDVHVVKEGPCDPPVTGGMAPKIVSPPEHVHNHTGGSAAMSCEVIGDPIPLVSWVKTNVNNKTSNLPGDDDSIMTLTQGGPEKHEVTGWLQIMELRKSHEADYTCVAYNKHGSDTRTARLKISKRPRRHQRHAKKE